MLVSSSTRSRRLIGRLDRGFDLIEGFAEVARTHRVRAGEVRAVGSVENVVLGEYDQRARVQRPPRRFDSPFELLALTAHLSEKDGKLHIVARATLSRERDNGIEVLGGVLVSARVFSCEFVLDTFDDLILRRAPDSSTGLSLWREAVPLGEPDPGDKTHPDPPPFDAPARTEWKDVMHASEDPAGRVEEPTPIEPSPALKASSPDDAKAVPGDWIDHPKFGRCQVERIEGDYEFVSARLRNQRLIRLSLDVLTLVLVGTEGDRNLFRAEPAAR